MCILCMTCDMIKVPQYQKKNGFRATWLDDCLMLMIAAWVAAALSTAISISRAPGRTEQYTIERRQLQDKQPSARDRHVNQSSRPYETAADAASDPDSDSDDEEENRKRADATGPTRDNPDAWQEKTYKRIRRRKRHGATSPPPVSPRAPKHPGSDMYSLSRHPPLSCYFGLISPNIMRRKQSLAATHCACCLLSVFSIQSICFMLIPY